MRRRHYKDSREADEASVGRVQEDLAYILSKRAASVQTDTTLEERMVARVMGAARSGNRTALHGSTRRKDDAARLSGLLSHHRRQHTRDDGQAAHPGGGSRAGTRRRHYVPLASAAALLLVLLAIGLVLAPIGGRHHTRRPSTVQPAKKPAIGLPAPVAPTSFSAAGCRQRLGTTITQSMNGDLSFCTQVGDISPGQYHIVVDQLLLTGKGGVAKPGATPGTGPAVELTVAPASGPPGTTVTVTGRLPASGPPGTLVASPLGMAGNKPGHADMCWDGCRDGLQYQGVALTWTSPTTFQGRLVIPGAAWIERHPDRVAPLRSGTYPIGVQCLTNVPGCAGGGTEGSAAFQLLVPATVKHACLVAGSCAGLSATPDTAAPGDVVKVTGFAPLVSVIGSNGPFVFQSELERGPSSSTQLRFATPNMTGAVNLYIGSAPLAVIAPVSLANLPSTKPLAESTDGLSPVTANPANTSVMAWCSTNGITVTGPGYHLVFPTSSVRSAISQTGLSEADPSAPSSCAGVGVMGNAGQGAGGVGGALPVVAAAFSVFPADQNPMVALVALATLNGGKTWSPIPVPHGASADSFSSFAYSHGRLEALFAQSSPSSGGGNGISGQVPLVEEASASGTTWQAGSFSCPATGPCIRFGAYRPGNCAMNGSFQSIVRSYDGGREWSYPSTPPGSSGAGPSAVQACAPATLAAVSPGTELLVASGSPYLVDASTDSGSTWQVLGIPPIPGLSPDKTFLPGNGGLMLLPDGSLLAWEQGSPGGPLWELLTPHADRWCALTSLMRRADRAATQGPLRSSPVVIGPNLWWQASSASGALLTTGHVPLASIRC